MTEFDILIVGGGIAGASLGAALPATLRGAILEREPQPGYHSTGRSAAVFSEIYGDAPIRALSRASRGFLDAPGPEFGDRGLLHPLGALHIARADQLDRLGAFAGLADVAPAVRWIDQAKALQLCPILRPDHVAAAVFEPGAADIDVHALHQGLLRRFRAQGGAVISDAGVTAIRRSRGVWRVTTPQGELAAPFLVNAAGAWADALAALAGVAPVGLSARRRTVLTVESPTGVAPDGWPLTIDIDETFYFKPDAGRILLSPADETETLPCDVQPEELDVAITIDRIERATTLSIRRLLSKWAGLRTFAPDRAPVVGFDAQVPGFFWLAGQGGYGIQTAPALGVLAASLVAGHDLPADLAAFGVAAEPLSPSRFRQPVPADRQLR